MRAIESIDDSEWDEWVREDVDGLAAEQTSAFLRSSPALRHWRAALVRYQREQEEVLRALRGDRQRAVERQEASTLTAAITRHLSENKKLQKAANIAVQAEAKAAAKQRRREAHSNREARKRAESLLRSDPEGSRLHNSIHQMSLRLNRWATGLVEEMGLDEEDEEWSRWCDEVKALARMIEQYEAMVSQRDAS